LERRFRPSSKASFHNHIIFADACGVSGLAGGLTAADWGKLRACRRWRRQVADNQQAAVTDFPQLPYQGTPPSLRKIGALSACGSCCGAGTTARLMQTVAHPDDEDGGS